MRVVAIVVLLLAVPVGAQQADSSVSFEAVRAALQKSQQPWLVSPPLPPWIASPTRLGILTFVPPDTNGEAVKVFVPAGELVTRVAHAITSAQHRRAERKAHENVLRELQDFQAQTPAR
jgi:hypothetical protein